MYFRTIFIILCIILAVLFICQTNGKEGMIGSMKPRCPNVLIQKGPKVYLYNTKIAEVPGVNPIVFNNLEEYTQFIDWQRSQGIRCPVLYLQETYDCAGNLVCKTRPCTMEPQGGLPPTNTPVNPTTFDAALSSDAGDGPSIGIDDPDSNARPGSSAEIGANRYPNLKRRKLLDAGYDDPPFNRGHYPSYDPSSFYRGVHTPLDQLDVIEESKPVSNNAMDPNWGGKQHTQNLIDSGFYKDNEVYHYE